MHEDGVPTLPTNQSRVDRGIRIAIAAVVFAIGVSGVLGEPASGALRIASIVPFALGALGWCPLYEALGIGTNGPAGARSGANPVPSAASRS